MDVDMVDKDIRSDAADRGDFPGDDDGDLDYGQGRGDVRMWALVLLVSCVLLFSWFIRTV